MELEQTLSSKPIWLSYGCQKVIQNAANLFEFAQENLSLPLEKANLSRRIFLKEEVKGNRVIHSVLASRESKRLQVLSCYCDCCLEEDYENCVKEAFVKPWEEHILELEAPERKVTRNDVGKMRGGLLDLIAKNSTVAIAAADVGEIITFLKSSQTIPNP